MGKIDNVRLLLGSFLCFFFALPVVSAVAAVPSAEIFLQSPAREGEAVRATDRESLQYRIEFNVPIDSLESAYFDLAQSPPGNWVVANLQTADRRVWTFDVWRSSGSVGSGNLVVRLLPESVSAGGEPGPSEPVLSPSLLIDFDSPQGTEFEFSNNLSSLSSGPLGSDWYLSESWLDLRTWIDSGEAGNVRMALEENALWKSLGGESWSKILEGSGFTSIESFGDTWWVLESDGDLRSEAGAWESTASLPGDGWKDLAVFLDRLWALRGDGTLYSSLDGETWAEESGALSGEWNSIDVSPSALLLSSSSGQARRLLRGSWSSGQIPGSRSLWAGGYWWSATDEGDLYRSPSGLGTWEALVLPSTLSIKDIIFSAGRLYLLRTGEAGLDDLLQANITTLEWTGSPLPLGSWQKIISGPAEMTLLGEGGQASSGGALHETSSLPEFLFAESPVDSASWQETISRASAAFVDGKCGTIWTEDYSDVFWPASEPLAEDRCWRYTREVQDAAGNRDVAAAIFAYAVRPSVTEWSRSESGVIGADALEEGILYNLRFSEPLEAGELDLSDFSFGGSAGGSWNGELATTDNQNWTLRVSSENASSGTLWIELEALSVSDPSGNRGPLDAARSSSATLDLQPPDKPLWSTAPPAIISNNSISVSFLPQEEGGTLFCTLDISSPGEDPCPSPRSWFLLAEGTHTIRIWHRDDVGNMSEPLVHTFLVDTIRPPAPSLETSITNNSFISSRDALFSWSSEEETECSWQDQAWESCSSPISFSELQDGSYSFRVRARDAADNISEVAGRSWAVDTEPPSAPAIESAPPAASASSSATFIWSEETGADSECKLQEGAEEAPWQPCSSPRLFAFLDSGNYTFSVRQRDRAGNLSEETSWSWQVILSAPSRPRIISGPAEISSLRSATFVFAGDDSNALQCLVGSLWEECASPYSLEDLADGSRTFQVRQVNEAGTVGPAALWSWVVDGTPPAAPEVDVRPPLWTQAELAAFAWRSEIGTTSLCSLDEGPWSECTSVWELQGLPEGVHNFQIRSRDQAGNLSEIWQYSWNIDRTAPASPVWTSGPEGPTDGLESVFAWQGEEGATFSCSLDEQPWDTCSSPKTLRFIVAGEHTFRVRQRDRSGNISEPASRTWTIDLSNPDSPEVIDRPRRWTRSGYASFSWINDRQNRSECSLDSGAWQRCSSPWETRNLAAGQHVFRVRQVRPSGRSGAPARVSWGIDQAAPLLESIRIAKRGNAFRVKIRASDKGGSRLHRLRLRPGRSYPVSVRKIRSRRLPRKASVCDLAGNCSPWLRVQKGRSERVFAAR